MIEVLGEEECLARLATSTVGRIGHVEDGRVEIIPVNYRIDGRDLYLRTREDGILSGLPDEPDIAFEVDHIEGLEGSGWSVLLGGRVERLEPGEGQSIDAAAHVRPWAGGERTLWFRFVIERISGRSVRRSNA
ncbi:MULTISPECIES: pyridoxamine 5'-phosphate oxidase family protein [unclassified Microbacterium]|uniref:pyridoxamine 5'-phosphate oxidase family protein n=1 Tax=unclassified Microbacterium TaxID=2609290 RepID=UPI0012FCF5E2|nr:pyridoxamine 5'-phosphate oxidase family protein [Microbacterium sp. MAH-37]MVQ42124.1 pyridoxamine 5'-phosphate oxidase family protein [Microbacterium sp. MAH-37]